jgi:hypothetical protein
MTAAAPRQTMLAFLEKDRNVLARMDTAMQLLSLHEDRVLSHIDTADLIAFDLRGKNADRVCPGIWWHRLKEFGICREIGQMPASWPDVPLDDVIKDLFPFRGQQLHLSLVINALGIRADHCHHLLDDGLLKRVPGTGDSVNRPPLITRASVAEFLERRRM